MGAIKVMRALVRNAKEVVNILFHVGFHRASIFYQYYYSFPMRRFGEKVKNGPDAMDMHATVPGKTKDSITAADYSKIGTRGPRSKKDGTIFREQR